MNSNFGLWVLSTVVIGVLTFSYSIFDQYFNAKRGSQRKIERIDAEIASRMKVLSLAILNKETQPSLFNETLISLARRDSGYYPVNLYAEYKAETTAALLSDLSFLVEVESRDEILKAKAVVESFYADSVLHKFLQKNIEKCARKVWRTKKNGCFYSIFLVEGFAKLRHEQLNLARKLGYNLTELPPGKAQCPFHNHHGEGELRFGAKRYPIRKHDVIACPTGGPEVAHQIINTGTTRMRYLELSSVADIGISEYPDSNKIMIGTGARGEAGLLKMFRSENTLEHYDRESNEPLKSDA